LLLPLQIGIISKQRQEQFN